jgi:hypothetical protein
MLKISLVLKKYWEKYSGQILPADAFNPRIPEFAKPENPYHEPESQRFP